jgi:hypothetical protein
MPKKILKTQPTIDNKRAAGSFRVFRLRWVFPVDSDDASCRDPASSATLAHDDETD